MATRVDKLILRSPGSPSDWDLYFDLRWRILRAPWGQPRGSERDSAEESAFHLLLLDPAGKAVACGRLHRNNPDEAQVRYMAVDEDVRGRAYGGRILKALEAQPRRRKAGKFVLNAEKRSCNSTFGTVTR
jgi:GNAT superfamily N-acetyltransferase